MKDFESSSFLPKRTNHINILQIQGNDAIKQQKCSFYLYYTKVERASFHPGKSSTFSEIFLSWTAKNARASWPWLQPAQHGAMKNAIMSSIVQQSRPVEHIAH